MAYDEFNPPSLIGQGVAGGARHFQYSWTDPIATVLAAGYITNAKELGLREGDSLRYSNIALQDVADYHLIVSALDDTTGTATLAFPEIPQEAMPAGDVIEAGDDYVVMLQGGRQTRVPLDDFLAVVATDLSGTINTAITAKLEAGTETPDFASVEVSSGTADALESLPVTPTIRSSDDPTSGLYIGETAGTPFVAIIVRGVPSLTFYRPAAGANNLYRNWRMGSYEGLLDSNSSPDLALTGDTDRPILAIHGLLMKQQGDVTDVAVRFENGDYPYKGTGYPYDDEASGRDAVSYYTQPMNERYNGSHSYGSNWKTGIPILLVGAGPDFSATVPNGGSALSGYVNDRGYPLRFPAASGTTPRANLNGWGLKKILRHNGAAPGSDYWSAFAEGIFVYSSAADGGNGALLAEDNYGTDDGGAGLDEDLAPAYWFGRSTAFVQRIMGNPTPESSTGMWEMHVTFPHQIVDVPTVWGSSVGFLVAGGWTTFADGTDGSGGYLNEWGYDATRLPLSDNRPRNRKGDYGGPVVPTVVQGWANVSIPASDAGRVMALGIRKSTHRDEGVDFGITHSNSTFIMAGVQTDGVGAINITAIDDNGEGNVRMTVASPHGMTAVSTVRIVDTTAGTGAYAAAAGDIDGDGFWDGVYTAIPISTTVFDLPGIIYKPLSVAGTVKVVNKANWLEFTYKSGDIFLSKSLKTLGGAFVNYVEITGKASGSPPEISVKSVGGADTNQDLRLNALGTGVLRWGTWTNNADAAVNGYITIKDAAGNTRKLATIA